MLPLHNAPYVSEWHLRGIRQSYLGVNGKGLLFAYSRLKILNRMFDHYLYMGFDRPSCASVSMGYVATPNRRTGLGPFFGNESAVFTQGEE